MSNIHHKWSLLNIISNGFNLLIIFHAEFFKILSRVNITVTFETDIVAAEHYLCFDRHLLCLSDLYHNLAWMSDWHSLSWFTCKLGCSVNDTGLGDWLILVCWSSKEEVRKVVFHARRVPWMLTEHRYSCAPLNVDRVCRIYEWRATFSTVNPVASWLHFWRSAGTGKLHFPLPLQLSRV